MAQNRRGWFSDVRLLSVFVFGLYYTWVTAIPYQGSLLFAVGASYGIDPYPLMYACVLAHLIGLLVCGFFCTSIGVAKSLLHAGFASAFVSAGLLLFAPSMLSCILLIAASGASGLSVAAWALYVRRTTPHTLRMKTATGVLLVFNTLMVLIDLVMGSISNAIALVFLMAMQVAGSIILHRVCALLPGEEPAVKTVQAGLPSIRGPLGVLCLFILLSTIDAGLSLQIIKPAFEHLTSLSWFWFVPYIAAVIVIRMLPNRQKHAVNSMYIAIAMSGLAYLAFFTLPHLWGSYILVDTLLMGSMGIFHAYWWGAVSYLFSLSNNPARVLGVSLSSNVVGVLLGIILARMLSDTAFSHLSGVVALGTIFTMVALMPLVQSQLLRVLGKPPTPNTAEAEQNEQPLALLGLLSQREQEVAKLLLQGRSYRMIAEELHISENTVKTYVKNIYSKTGVQSRTDLMRLGYHRNP